MSRSSSRILAVALLLAVLTVPCAHAGEPASARPGGATVVDLLDRAWQSLVSLWMDNGCGIDPSGRCLVAPTVDNGCGADPSGRCAAATAPDNGCIIDPNGRCRSGG